MLKIFKRLSKRIFIKAPQAGQKTLAELADWIAKDQVQPMLVEQRSVLDLPEFANLQPPVIELCVSKFRFCPLETVGLSYLITQQTPRLGFTPQASISADFRQLPLPNQFAKTVLIHHALDYNANPHQVLREVSRIVDTDGEVIIFGFNPYSSLGLWLKSKALTTQAPYSCARQIPLGRMCDWLKLLGFRVSAAHRGFYQLPIKPNSLLKLISPMARFCERWQWPGGGYYVIRAHRHLLMPEAGARDWRQLLTPLPANHWDCAKSPPQAKIEADK